MLPYSLLYSSAAGPYSVNIPAVNKTEAAIHEFMQARRRHSSSAELRTVRGNTNNGYSRATGLHLVLHRAATL